MIAIATFLSLLATATCATAASQSAPPPAQIPNQDPVLVNIIAYEFPFCLASQSELLQNLFVSRPTDTKLVTSSSGSGQKSESECRDVNASKGVPHSFFYTADGAVEGCELWTFEEESCGGEKTVRELGGVGFSECFSRPEKFVKPLLKSAKVVCG
ncbi:hypothetical protein Q7P37_005350 [Cladosporium fusiforme]